MWVSLPAWLALPRMKPKQTNDGKSLVMLGIGFALTIVLLLVSAYVAIDAMRDGEARMMGLAQEQQITDKLADDIQGEEAGLSSLFYSLVREKGEAESADLLKRLALVEDDVNRTFVMAMARSDAEHWRQVRTAVQEFTRELRHSISSKAPLSDGLYETHFSLVRELGVLVSANYERAVEAQTREHSGTREKLSNSVYFLACAVLLSILCAAQTIYSTSRVLRRARWQARELSRLSGHVLEAQEATLRRLSRELHDEFGQTLSAIEANVAAIPVSTPDQQARIEDCLLLVQDAISNVRELSQLLRPSILDDFGLKAGLQSLADSFGQRTGIEVRANIDFEGRLPGETETHLFRIAQEALTNVVRHSGAKHVNLTLASKGNGVALTISDDGHGLTPRNGRSGFGMMGMRERMHAAGGELLVDSRPGGLTVTAEVPLNAGQQQEDPSPTSG